MTHPVRVALVAMLVACSNGGTGESPSSDPQRGSATAPGPSASAARPRSPLAGTWRGKFKAQRKQVLVPSGVPYPSWKTDPGGSEGDGEIELVVADDGTISGKATGALGDLEVSGRIEDGALRAGVTPADPEAENAMTGVLTGKAEPEALSGEIKVASGDASVVRTATVKLTKD